MNNDEVTSAVSTATGQPKAVVAQVIQAYGQFALKSVKGGAQVPLHGVGTLKPVHREAREGRNPKTGEKIMIEASASLKLNVSDPAKRALNNI